MPAASHRPRAIDLAPELKSPGKTDIMDDIREIAMPDLLVRDIDPEVYKRMKATAAAQGKSLAQTAREALTEKFNMSREDVWAEIDRFRDRIGPLQSNSTADIREARDRAAHRR
jgi:plasmid stability protein